MRFKRKLQNHEDWEFYVRWAIKGNWSEFLDSELCVYNKYPKSLCTDKQKMKEGYNTALKYISKHSRECNKLVQLRIEIDNVMLKKTNY